MNGEWAGGGPIDYNESKVIYLFVRTRKPRNVLEIGFASGVSSSLIAKALEMNGEGNLYTGDLNSDPSHEWIISDFKKYIKKGIIKATYPIDGVQFVDNMDNNIPIDITFSDASHEKDFCHHLAIELREKYPDALHLYHEYSFSPLSGEKFKNWISAKENLNHQRFYEREAFEEMFEARIIRPTGINNQSRVPAKPLAPSQNRNGNRSSVMVFQRASRALENLLDECSQWIKSTGAGHIKWRSLPPRSTAHVIWREVSPVTTQSPTLHPSDPLGFTIKAESRIAVRRRVGQSSSQMPKTTPPICPALCIPMKPSRSRPVRATVPLICNKYPRLIKLTTGIAETTAKPKIKETIPKHQPVAE